MKSFVIAGAVLALTTGAACAQPAPGKMAKVDANGDGKVTLAEWKASRADQMMKLDANHDGKLSKDEFAARGARRAAKAPEGGMKGDGSRMFGRLDTNADGFLDKSEIGKLAEKRFARADADGDGVLTTAELQAAHQKGAAKMGGGE